MGEVSNSHSKKGLKARRGIKRRCPN